MSRSQRLTFLVIAVVIAVVAVIVLVTAGGGDDEETASSGGQPTATPTATAATATTADDGAETPEPAATAAPEPPLVTTDGITKLRFKQGDTVVFRVRSDVSDEVHVHGYDLMKDVEAGQTVTFSFPADITGIFEVELEGAGKQIAQLRVDP